MVRFRVGYCYFGIDAFAVEAIDSIFSEQKAFYRPFDLEEWLRLPWQQKDYHKVILLRMGKTEQSALPPVGILAEHVEDIEEVPIDALRKLPPIIADRLEYNLIFGVALGDASICFLIDTEKVIDLVSR